MASAKKKRAQRKKRYEMNKDAERSTMKQYHDKHKNDMKTKFKQYYENNIMKEQRRYEIKVQTKL